MKKLSLSLLTLALVAIAPIIPSRLDISTVAQADTVAVVVLDVAFECGTFVLNRVDPSATEGKRGDTFVLNGKIFPGGTIPAGSGFDPSSPGSIGNFICRGTQLYDDSDPTAAPPFVATTQIFVLNGGNALITAGLEAGVSPVTRAVTGGWGKRYSGASGEVTLDLIGFNITGCENYRCTFKLKK
jgi:hypothetical protein